MLRRILIPTVFLLGIVALVIYLRRPPSEKVRAQRTIERAHIVDLLLHQIGNTTTLLAESTSDTNFGSHLAQLLSRHGWQEGISTNRHGAPEIVDGWNRPFDIIHPTNALTEKLPFDLRRKNAMILWSSGPNGTNDWGLNDDIYFAGPATP